MTARQLQGIPPIRLHPVAGLGRNQRWRYDRALDPQLRQLPIQHIARWTRLVAGTQMLRRTQPLNQLADRLFAVGDRSQAANLAIRLGYGNSKRLGMDIQSQKSYLFLHDRFLSACGSELCFLPESQPNPRSAHWAGHSILTRVGDQGIEDGLSTQMLKSGWRKCRQERRGR